ncbi:hypothetical protein [Streptomyces spiramenti]|uniref:Uncharacterized protein n=1 Tax=Streptomyces spiramenti TaxID=2720606 RepID=A0ABX1ARD3_9ACTN|nr:hypothetical protein [Streptomyces spiramenti]NJP68701.1 hypothetical protein [Streptomyces spiramenti]
MSKPKSKLGVYISIGTSVFGVIGIAKQLRSAREDHDTLQLVDGIVSAAAVITGVALLGRELRRMNEDIHDVLSD